MSDTIPQDDIPCKQCTACLQWLPATLERFTRKQKGSNELRNICKQCTKEGRRVPKPVVPEGHKRCRQCLKAKPATPEFFRPDRQTKDGLRNQCRECRKAYRRKPLPHKPRKRKPVPTGDKQCIVCQQFFPRTREHFFSSSTAVDRLQSSCKKCYGQRNTQRERSRPAEERSRRNKEYYQSHKEAIRARYLRYQRSPRGKMNAKTGVLKRIARKKAVQGSYTSAQITEQLKRQKYRCYYAACGFAKFPRAKKNGQWQYKYHIEHTFPLSRVTGTDVPANDMGYLVLACPHCNRSKGNKFPWEWPEGGRLL